MGEAQTFFSLKIPRKGSPRLTNHAFTPLGLSVELPRALADNVLTTLFSTRGVPFFSAANF